MTASTMDLINAALAAPHTHKVVTTFDDGTSRTHETRSLATARNFAVGDTRNIGRKAPATSAHVSHAMLKAARGAAVAWRVTLEAARCSAFGCGLAACSCWATGWQGGGGPIGHKQPPCHLRTSVSTRALTSNFYR